MRTGKELVGKQVISIDDGSRLGSEKDRYLDGGLNSIVGVFLGRERIVSRKAKFIQSKDIKVFGKDAILVSSAQNVINSNRSKEFPRWIRRDQLQGRAVETPGGMRIAKVGDVAFDAAGKLARFGLTDIQAASPIKDKRFLSREVPLDLGSDSAPMKIDLPGAEKQNTRKQCIEKEMHIDLATPGLEQHFASRLSPFR